MTKTGQDCVTVSTDGYAHFWDIRKLKEDRAETLAIRDFNSKGEEITIGATSLENSPEAATKYIIGTEQGTLVIANKKPKKPVEINNRLGHDNRHLGPIYAIVRNYQYPKVFMTIGDWSAKVWMDDLKTPLIKTKYHDSYLSDGCFSPTRIGAFFLTRKDGWLDVWDYYYKQN
jgi:dynein intermediate chain 2